LSSQILVKVLKGFAAALFCTGTLIICNFLPYFFNRIQILNKSFLMSNTHKRKGALTMVELWQLGRVPRVAEDSGSICAPGRGRRAGPRPSPAPHRTRSPPAQQGGPVHKSPPLLREVCRAGTQAGRYISQPPPSSVRRASTERPSVTRCTARGRLMSTFFFYSNLEPVFNNRRAGTPTFLALGYNRTRRPGVSHTVYYKHEHK
jgi:hypothetical protein